VRRIVPACAVLLAAGALGSLAGHGTHAALRGTSGAPGNVLSAGTVTLERSGAGVVVALTGGRAGDGATGCVRVTSGGSLPTAVRLFGTSTGGLAAHVTLTVTRGTQPAAASGCTGFVADAENHIGAGAGVVYSGPLAAYPASAAAGLVDPHSGAPEVWTAGEAHAYRIAITLGSATSAQGLSGSATLRWRGYS